MFTHPKKEVHPDVFAHTCKIVYNNQTNSSNGSRSLWTFMNIRHRTMLMSRFGESDTLTHRKETTPTQSLYSMVSLTVQCPGFYIKKSKNYVTLEKKPSLMSSQLKVTMFGSETTGAQSTLTKTPTSQTTGSLTSTISSSTISPSSSIKSYNKLTKINSFTSDIPKVPLSSYLPRPNIQT